jgi:hypothetical protein
VQRGLAQRSSRPKIRRARRINQPVQRDVVRERDQPQFVIRAERRRDGGSSRRR